MAISTFVGDRAKPTYLDFHCVAAPTAKPIDLGRMQTPSAIGQRTSDTLYGQHAGPVEEFGRDRVIIDPQQMELGRAYVLRLHDRDFVVVPNNDGFALYVLPDSAQE
ncbi:MAG: hypothetical protein F4Y67_04440 [Chloroflexi bacterium]|nr:hypothetical protein [Chloroflexota bacterium]